MCSIGRTSHQSLILYTVARLDTGWRDIEGGNGLPVTTATPRYGKIPSVDGIECSEETSNANIGPAVDQALTLLSAEVGEGRRVTDTVVSIHNGEKEDEYSHKPSAALTLPASAPVTLSVPPMRVIPP